MSRDINIKRTLLNAISNIKSDLSNLTLKEIVNQFTTDIDEYEHKTIEKENILINEFTNTYLKSFDDNRLFGDEVELLHITNIKVESYNTDWERTYLISGTRIVFHKGGFYRRELDTSVHSTYTERELRNGTKITEEEFNQYSKDIDTLEGIISKALSNK